jgi:hypothetical protein
LASIVTLARGWRRNPALESWQSGNYEVQFYTASQLDESQTDLNIAGRGESEHVSVTSVQVERSGALTTEVLVILLDNARRITGGR